MENVNLKYRGNPLETVEITMEVTPFMEKLIKEHLNCEIDMLQGDITKMQDGRTRYHFKSTVEKAEPIRQFMMAIIIKQNEINLN